MSWIAALTIAPEHGRCPKDDCRNLNDHDKGQIKAAGPRKGRGRSQIFPSSWCNSLCQESSKIVPNHPRKPLQSVPELIRLSLGAVAYFKVLNVQWGSTFNLRTNF